jgi:hypothetical protein
MRLKEFSRLKTYLVKLKLRQPGYTQIINTTLQARNPDQARKILRAQYNKNDIIVGNPRELKSR